MADKGFDVQELFAESDVTVNHPTFFCKKNRIDQQTVLKDRKIASKRVPVEWIIGPAKTYKITVHPLSHIECILAYDIIFISFMFRNFRRCIVPRNAWVNLRPMAIYGLNHVSGINLAKGSANGRWHFKDTSTLIGWPHCQIYLRNCISCKSSNSLRRNNT